MSNHRYNNSNQQSMFHPKVVIVGIVVIPTCEAAITSFLALQKDTKKWVNLLNDSSQYFVAILYHA